MAPKALVSWSAPAHIYTEKKSDWYWAVGIITLALAVTAFLFGEIIVGLFVIVAAATLVLHAGREPHAVSYEINDRGIVRDNIIYPFVSLDSFWIPDEEEPAKLILKSRKMFMPLIIIYIDEINPEDVRQVLLKYIAEVEHREPLTKKILERLGF